MPKTFFAISMLISISLSAWAQRADVAARLGYPEMVLYNGKVVTMDDPSFESKVGTIVQAIAVRGNRILATGSNAEIQALAGPKTKSIDLKGKVALPSFVITHEHPTDWAFQEPRAMTHVMPDGDPVIHMWMPNIAPKQQLAKFEPMMQEALRKAKPGQWIFLSFNYGPDYEHATEMSQLFAKSISKAWLDQLAPDNPVKVRNGFITSFVNQKAIDELKNVHPSLSVISEDGGGGALQDFLKYGGGFSRPVEPDAMFKGRLPLLAQVLKSELELWASYGATAFASSPYAYNNLAAFHYLDQRGEMPARFAWGYPGPQWDIETLRILASTVNTGTDRLWMVGAFGANGGNCMTVPERSDWKLDREELPGRREGCNLNPGSPARKRVEDVIKSGLRIATIHTGGDRDIDNLMDAIEEASKEAGFTLDEIRAKRHAFDHGAGAPRPAQIPRIKHLGMMASLNNTLLWEPPGVVPNMTGTSLMARIYGIEYTSWVSPRKSMTEGSVMTGFEIDRPLPHKIFFFLWKGMTRYNDRDRKVYGPGERTDRIVQLKALTRWGAYYVLREKLMGTLEPGKFADFVVLDQDVLTVPEDQIPGIKVLMTSVGGKLVHLTNAFGSEIGLTPVGATTWKENFPEGWK
ncbi:MAG: amidohydrolase family protein [Acidobacteria bacterium]|nr:amidohydrolase family protein [Acidobacteriota bacterium]